MASLEIRLFGRFSLRKGGQELECLQSAKAKELLCYLLLHRDRSHSREVLSTLLWGDCSTSHSKKYFRQTLWQLQQGLHEALPNAQVPPLQVEGESIRFNSQSNLWLDIDTFERAFTPVLAKHTKHLSLVDILSVGVDRMQRNFEPMRKQVEAWKETRLSDEAAKLVIYRAFVEGEFKPQIEEFAPRTTWSLSNAFRSAFKDLDPKIREKRKS